MNALMTPPHARRACLALCLMLACVAQSAGGQVPEKASPFTAVRWEGDAPVVRFEGQWYHFEGLDGLSGADILAYARQTYGDRWQKRFSEDLVEVLHGMGHTPAVDVRLTLRRAGETVVKMGRMTEENRRSAWRYNQGEEDEPAEAEQPAGEARDEEEKATERPAPEPADTAAGDETETQRQYARWFAEQIDQVWDQAPAEGTANLRFLVKKDGQPFAGKTSMHAEFGFSARGGRGLYITQAFNPNSNGRWVYEELAPGTYALSIKGTGRFEGWTWSQDAVTVAAGETLLFEIDLDER